MLQKMMKENHTYNIKYEKNNRGNVRNFIVRKIKE